MPTTRREFAASALLPLLAPATSGGVAAAAAASGHESGLIAFRIGTTHWLSDDRFAELLELFAAHKEAADEIVFFTSNTHPPLPLAEMERRAERLAKLLPRVRAAGWRAGINILATVGHHEENLPNSLDAPWPRMTDAWGRTSTGSFCPASPELIDYARRVYTAMAKAGPDVLWIDDDVRLAGHKPINLACFCDRCVANFNREAGREYTRETLRTAFNQGSLEQRMALRRRWLEHNAGMIDTLFQNIEDAVHAVKPGMTLGFMTGDRFYEGYAFARWAKTLAGPGNAPVRWRPGGGFYSDETLLGMVDKANALGRQAAALPASVTVIQSELENFPYQLLRKSTATTVVEAACHMAAGTTGTAFNVLTMTPGKVSEYAALYDRIAGFRPFYEKLQAELGRSTAVGVWPAWNASSFITVNANGEWLGSPGRMALSEMYTLQEIGIPMAYDQAGARVTALAGNSVLAFSRDELQRIFSKGVLMDTAAWLVLRELGLEKWTGVAEVTPYDRDATEVLTADAINHDFGGWGRDCRQSFWAERAYGLKPAAAESKALARLVDYSERDLGASLVASTNELGGRVAVMGYFPWTQIHSTAKATQLKSVCAWLSNGTIPATVGSYAKVVVWCREGTRGKQATVVVNASLDPIARLELLVHGEGREYVHATGGGGERRVSAVGTKDGYTLVILDDLAPWSIHLLTQQT
jgi:hypothetical protein